MAASFSISVLRRGEWLLSFAFFAALWIGGSALAATTNCTPTAGFTACKRITYSGADQTFTVPTGISSIEVRAWGAAGGGANLTWYTGQGGGAGGGFAQGTLSVTAGQVLTVVVGQGGVPNSTATTYGGGGAGGSTTTATAIGGSGGGYSGVFAPGGKTAGNARVLAGGGGGASPGADGALGVGAGGGGGSTGGEDAVPTLSGRGGTQVAGGAAATQNSTCNVLPTAGSQFQGGRGGDSSLTDPHEGGGGGGGGWFGGGGGMCQSGSSTQNGGGGGGSSYIAGSGVTAASTTAGANFLYAGTACSGVATSGGSADALYSSGIGEGSCYGTGGNGEVVIQYRTATVQISKTSVGGVGGFSFSGGNGIGSETLTTVTSGVAVSGATHPLDNSSTATTVTETIPVGYVITAISCTGLGSGTATYNLTAGTASLNAAATAAANSVVCAFTNAKLPTLRVSKISNGGTGTFSFTGSNGFGSDSVTTVTPGVAVNGTVKVLSALNTATTLTETIPATYFLAGLNCTGLGSGSATYNLTSGTASLDAAATAAGNAIVCTYSNTLAQPSLSISKSASTAGPVSAGQVVTYTFTVTNTGNRPLSNVGVSETFNGYGTAPVPAGETLFTDAVPTGDSTDGTANDGSWQTLGVGDVIRFTGSYTVTQADIDNLQ